MSKKTLIFNFNANKIKFHVTLSAISPVNFWTRIKIKFVFVRLNFEKEGVIKIAIRWIPMSFAVTNPHPNISPLCWEISFDSPSLWRQSNGNSFSMFFGYLFNFVIASPYRTHSTHAWHTNRSHPSKNILNYRLNRPTCAWNNTTTNLANALLLVFCLLLSSVPPFVCW